MWYNETNNNMSDNTTNSHHDYISAAYHLSQNLSKYLSMVGIPILILIGITGSSLSLWVFSTTKLRNQSCTVYLAYLIIVDCGFLCSLIPPWLSWVGVDIFYTNGWCQTTLFASSFFSFLSVWIVVAFSVERYIVVYHPFKKAVMCTRKRALTVLVCLTGCTFVMYSYMLFMTGIQKYRDTDMYICDKYPKYRKITHYLATVDIFTTMIIPVLSIAILNTAIIIKLCKLYQSSPPRVVKRTYNSSKSDQSSSQHEETQMTEWKTNVSTTTTAMISLKEQHSMSRQDSPKPGSIQAYCVRRRNQYQLRTTRSLVLISSTFVLLNTPSHIFKLYFILAEMIGALPGPSPHIHIAQECTQFLYYVNFATNMLQYVAFSQSFRSALVSLVRKCRQRRLQRLPASSFRSVNSDTSRITRHCGNCFTAVNEI